VDGSGRALVRIRLKNPTDATEAELDAWIDTGFTGELVLPQQNVASLGLPLDPTVMARLANGSEMGATGLAAHR
jgi:predicted aspartyl protease